FASFAVNIAFFLPFGLGAREGGLYAIFGLLGMPPELGVAASMLGRIRELTWIGLGLALGAVGGRRDGGLASQSVTPVVPSRPCNVPTSRQPYRSCTASGAGNQLNGAASLTPAAS